MDSRFRGNDGGAALPSPSREGLDCGFRRNDGAAGVRAGPG